MKKYPNGRVPAIALAKISGIKLRWPARTALAKAGQAAKKEHVALKPALPLGGYRSLAQQSALKANPAKYGSALKSSQIASPGSSTHGDGLKVDIAEGNAWFAKNCRRFGFEKQSPAGEDNHYAYIG